MKTFLGILLAALVTSASANAAVATNAVGVRKLYSSDTITTITWVPLLASSSKIVRGISVVNTGVNPVEIGLAAASDSANTEVRQLIAPMGGINAPVNPGNTVAANFFPIQSSQAVRWSVRALNSQMTQGELEVNFFY